MANSAADLAQMLDEQQEWTGHRLDLDPYALLAELRRQGPILPVDFRDQLPNRDVAVTLHPLGYADLDGPFFSALSYEAVDAVIRDSTHFDQEIQRRSQHSYHKGTTMTGMDGPEHRRTRNLVEQVFTRRAMQEWGSQIIEPLARERATRIAAMGPNVELVTDYFLTYPAEVITRLLGIPSEDIYEFLPIVMAVTNPLDLEAAQAAFEQLEHWVVRLLDERRASGSGGGDILSLLLAAESDGERMSDQEIVVFVRLLFAAGSETTYRSMSSLMVGLLTTGQWDLVVQDRTLVPKAVEEGLRWESPILGIARRAKADAEVCGMAIPKGSVVQAFMASANHDEARWDRPDVFDVTREQKPHSSFGFGSHMCIGKNLARLEAETALHALADVAPGMKLDPAVPEADSRIRGFVLRSPNKVPVQLR